MSVACLCSLCTYIRTPCTSYFPNQLPFPPLCFSLRSRCDFASRSPPLYSASLLPRSRPLPAQCGDVSFAIAQCDPEFLVLVQSSRSRSATFAISSLRRRAVRLSRLYHAVWFSLSIPSPLSKFLFAISPPPFAILYAPSLYCTTSTPPLRYSFLTSSHAPRSV